MTLDWRKPDGKMDLIRERFGGVPPYLWYGVKGEAEPLNDTEERSLQSLFFAPVVLRVFFIRFQLFDGRARFGDIELRSISGGDSILRIRNASKLPLELDFRGQVCPLVQVGLESNPYDSSTFNFAQEWSRVT